MLNLESTRKTTTEKRSLTNPPFFFFLNSNNGFFHFSQFLRVNGSGCMKHIAKAGS